MKPYCNLNGTRTVQQIHVFSTEAQTELLETVISEIRLVLGRRMSTYGSIFWGEELWGLVKGIDCKVRILGVEGEYLVGIYMPEFQSAVALADKLAENQDKIRQLLQKYSARLCSVTVHAENRPLPAIAIVA